MYRSPGTYERELYDYSWGIPTVFIDSVAIGNKPIDGLRKYKEGEAPSRDYTGWEKYERDLGMITEHNHYTYSIPLDDLIESSSPAGEAQPQSGFAGARAGAEAKL